MDLSRAAQVSDFLSSLMESGELFHPLRFTQEEAYRFLKDVPLFEESGILCRVPNWWKRKFARARVNVRIGDQALGALSGDALVALTPSFALDEVDLTREDIENLLMQAEGLSLIKGKWIEIDHDRLNRLLEIFDQAQAASLSVFEAIREVSDGFEEGDLVTYHLPQKRHVMKQLNPFKPLSTDTDVGIPCQKEFHSVFSRFMGAFIPILLLSLLVGASSLFGSQRAYAAGFGREYEEIEDIHEKLAKDIIEKGEEIRKEAEAKLQKPSFSVSTTALTFKMDSMATYSPKSAEIAIVV